jgi:hypothetical protein
MMIAPNMAYLDDQELLNQKMGRITAIDGDTVTYKKGDGKLYTIEVGDLIIVGGLASEGMNEAPVKKAGNYLELQDEYYNYTNMSARAVGPSKTRVTLHQGDLYGEPDIKKVVDMPFSEFVEKLKAAGAEQDPANDTVFFDMNPDGVEEFLRTLGLDL